MRIGCAARRAEKWRRAGAGARRPADRAVLVSQGAGRRPVMFKPLSRRTIIRGACGVAIGLPFLEAMQPPRARAADTTPKRLISFWTANGQIPSYWVPTGTETNFVLNKAHVPLE